MILLGRILNPRGDGRVDYFSDGAIATDADGRISYVGGRSGLRAELTGEMRRAAGLILPPMIDAHIHIPQHPVRGRFMEGIEANPHGGRLLAGLNRNVFPAEGKCSEDEYTRVVVQSFLKDTLAKGVVGGAAYMTVHAPAARIALEMLPETWSVGLVLMNMNCPEYLRTDEKTLEEDVRALAEDFGRRLIVTDRFAVSVDSPLRKRAVKLAEELGLRMQTHLNEQIPEKRFVEHELYPGASSYTNVYLRDGLLDRDPILAHCVRMSGEEFDVVAARQGCSIAHCPTSNTLLGSGVMPLDEVRSRGIPWAIATDVGASPTVSLLAEMAQFLKVHGPKASACEALWHTTVAPARMLGLADRVGSFEVGKPLSYVEVELNFPAGASAEEVIQLGLLQQAHGRDAHATRQAIEELREKGLDRGAELEMLEADVRLTCDRMEYRVMRVVLEGREVFRRDDLA